MCAQSCGWLWRLVRTCTRIVSAALIGPALAAGPGTEEAEPPSREQQIAWKLTPTYESSTREAPAWDFNLRGNTETQTGWVGYYRRQEEFQQLRLGYERPVDLSPVRFVPTLQYATRGFLGASINGEIGERYFAIAGWSRTNLKENFSITFDPNESVTFGVGTRWPDSTALSLFQIRDNRLNTGQRVTHLIARMRPTPGTRIVLDVFHKQGRPDADPASEQLRGTGLTVTYDFDRYFIRVASDPFVNFTDSHMVRMALGIRF